MLLREPNDCATKSLAWRAYDGGRLILAAAVIGYFELSPGERFRHVHLTEDGMSVTDLGPCNHGMLDVCKEICERYHRRLAGDVLV